MGKWAELGYAELYAGDFDSALKYFRKGAEENDTESCWGIVELYESCLPKDPSTKAEAKSEAMKMCARRRGTRPRKGKVEIIGR